MKRYIYLLLLCVCCTFRLPAQVSFGDATRFNDGWLFPLADDSLMSLPTFDDKDWRKLDLPHDWSVEGHLSPDLASCTG